jgi:hypothetical protein
MVAKVRIFMDVSPLKEMWANSFTGGLGRQSDAYQTLSARRKKRSRMRETA